MSVNLHLLNTLLNEEKAIVSEIAGTTRDAIEDELIIDGVSYRFIDTAGIRKTKDVLLKVSELKKLLKKHRKSTVSYYLLNRWFDTKK